MVIKEKYKKNEIGIIPIDWESKQLKKSSDIYRGGSPRPIQEYLTSSNEGCNWIKIGDVSQNAKFINSTKEKIIKTGVSKSRAVSIGDLILSNSMSFGRPYILNIDGCIHDGWLVIQNYNKDFDKDFLYYMLSSKIVQEQYSSIAAGSGVQNLNKEKVENIYVFVPSIPEQKEIASVLSDIDALIENLEKLINKKMNIKTGIMEDLLTGKKRLNGFKESWTEINMSKESKVKARIGWQGLTTDEYLNEGFAYLITGTDFDSGRIKWHGCHYVAKNRYVQDTNIQIQNNDILITKDGTIGKVALVNGLCKPATLNSGIFVIRPLNKKYDVKFLFYILTSSIFTKFLEKLTAGSTITHLYQKDLINFVFKAPVEIKEQEEIAQLLYDIDMEITELKEKLSKYQQIKIGMMDKLLTGKIRLLRGQS